MRKLTSLCSMWKPSRATRRLLFATSSFSTALAITLGSCRVRDDEDDAVVKPNAAEVATDIGLPQANVLARESSSICTPDKLLRLPWRAQLRTAVGTVPVQWDMSGLQSAQVVVARIGEESIQLPVRELVTTEDIQSLCNLIPADKMKDDAVQALGSMPLARTLMGRLLPNCDFRESISDTWDCRWQARSVASSGEELLKVERQILTRWSRHPYALIRRLSMARLLHHALSSKTTSTKLVSFCKVAAQSLPIELPLIVRSEAWQKHVCQEPDNDTEALAAIGLSMALDEVLFLSHSFEKQSHQALLAVQLPASGEARRRDYWVSLQQVIPAIDPAAQAVASNEAGTAANQTPEPVYSCWTPFFPWRSELTALALAAGAMSYDPKQSCQRKDTLSANDMTKAQQYLEASITSESEFTISNGRAKILQLPTGEYTYAIKPHLSLFESSRPDAVSVIAKGLLSWDPKTRRNVITANK